MASFPNQILSNGPEGKVLTREEAIRSLVVTNIAPQTTDEDIVIYFQRQRNRGGEINYVHIPSKGTAVVTFDEIEVAARVLEHPHTLHGSNLKLCRFIPTEARQVFKEVKARVNFENIHLLPRPSKDILEIIKENTDVELEYRKDTEDVIMTGTFDQIETAHKLLRCLVSQEMKREKKVTSYGDIAEPSKFEVQPQFMKLLKRVLNKKLREIEENSCVKIRCDENMSQVFIRPSKITAKQNHFQEGCDAFIDLYQKFIPNIGREEVNPPKDADTAFIQEAVATAEAENPMIIEQTEGFLVVYAEKKSMKRLVQSLKEELGLMIDKEPKRSQGNKRFDARSEKKTPQQVQVSMTQHLEHALGNGVKLSLYQGDITDEAVDAIVNAANERLQHGGGVAAAIVRKGGRQIQEESNRLIKRYGPLDVGEADYTSGGSLSCRHVIHTVGPEWFRHGKDMSKSLLRRACLESLRLAVQLNVSSIALTAISSGIFGMPKDICAEIMFESIEEFSVSEDAKLSTLRDIRIVIIDDPTLTVFQEEFVKRYMAQETSQETLERSFYQQEKTSPNPKSEPKTEKSKINDSSLVTRQTQTGSRTFSGEQREQNETFASSSVPEEVGESIHSSMPDSIRDVSLSNHDNEGEMKDTLTTGQLDPVKGDEKTFYSVSHGKARGKPRGYLAPSFHSSPGKDPSVTQNRSNTMKDVADTRRPGSIAANNATTSTLPPALGIAREGKPLAGLKMTSDQQSNADDSPEDKDAEEKYQPGGEVVKSTKQIQDSEYTKQNVDSENSQTDSTNGNTTDQKTKSESNLTTKTKASEENFKPSPDTFKEGEKELLNSNTEMSSQDPVAMSTTTGTMQSAMENSPQENSSASPPYSSSDHSISPHGVTKGEKDKVVGIQKDDEESGGQNNVAGSPSFLEAQTGHREMEQRCLMCMNFKNDLSSPTQCGGSHYYCNPCKDLLGSAGVCHHCRREDLPRGNQPIGIMTLIGVTDSSLPGYEHCGIIVMHFQFDEGIQGQKHPNPGQPYKALRTTAYLPFNSDGKEVCCLLRNAFDAGLLFVIGKSPTTREENKIICNGIELKTNQSGGQASCGYPDASYIDRVKRQMAEKGITQPRE